LSNLASQRVKAKVFEFKPTNSNTFFCKEFTNEISTYPININSKNGHIVLDADSIGMLNPRIEPKKDQNQELLKLWPKDIQYSSCQQGLNKLPSPVLKRMREVARTFVSDLVEIQKITDPAHPVCGECGLFAKATLLQGAVIGEYTGTVKLTDSKASGYASILFDDENIKVDVEGAQVGNEFRFVNDYRGTPAGKPNVKFSSSVVNQEYHIFVVTINKINCGKELLADYGSTYWASN